MTLASDLQRVAAAFAPNADPYSTPYAVQRITTPGAVNPAHLQLLDRAWADLDAGRVRRLIISVWPQAGKSQRGRAAVTWWLRRRPDDRVIIASFEAETAIRWGRAIRNDLLAYPELGLKLRADSTAAGRWDIAGHAGGVYCVGVGGALTGRPADLLLIDDPVKGRAQVESELYRERQWDWWENDAATRLGSDSRVVLVMTRWHEDDLAGRLLRHEPGEWTVINLPAVAESPDDPLGRAPGETVQDDVRGRDAQFFAKVRERRGPYVWSSLYQGRPSPPEGGILPRGRWQWYNEPRWTVAPDGRRWLLDSGGLVYQSWDLAFKGGDGSDFVVGQVWQRFGANDYLLDQVRGRMTFTQTVEALRDLAWRWPESTAKLVEDKANGPAVIDTLSDEVRGIVPVNPLGGKIARAHAVSPYVHAGNVHLPVAELAPWVHELVEECAQFPTGRHDDQVDALTQALAYLGEHEELYEWDDPVSIGPDV